MLLLEADGRGRHASVGVAMGGIAMPSSRLDGCRGTSRDAAPPARITEASPAAARCFPFPAAPFDLKKLCLKKLDKGFEAPPGGKDDDRDDSGLVNAPLLPLELGVAVADAALAAAEVL
jgi:hypothetical protein